MPILRKASGMGPRSRVRNETHLRRAPVLGRAAVSEVSVEARHIGAERGGGPRGARLRSTEWVKIHFSTPVWP